MRTFALRIIALLMLPGLVSAASFLPFVSNGEAYAVSADGSVVVGSSAGSGTGAFRWTATGGMVFLPNIPCGNLCSGDAFSDARAVSADGSVVVGQGSVAVPLQRSVPRAFRWTSGTGTVGLDSGFGAAWGVSADGSVVVGGDGAFRWSTSDGYVRLDELPGHTSANAYGISADGNVIVGKDVASAQSTAAVAWVNGSPTYLGDLLGGRDFGEANAVSSDGSVVVGKSESSNGQEAFRWTLGGGMVGLGDLVGSAVSSQALGVSGDGSVIVGSGWTEAGEEAFVWTESMGMRRLLDVLVANGVTGLTGWTLNRANGISADGLSVVGRGIDASGVSHAFVANISPVPIPAAVWQFGSALGLMGWMRRKALA